MLTVPDLSDYSTLIPTPARDVEILDSVPAVPGCCQLLQRFQSKGFSWPQRLCTFPRSPSARDLKLGNLLALLTGGSRASLGHSREVSEMALALPAASCACAFVRKALLVEGSSQVNSLQPCCSKCLRGPAEAPVSLLEMRTLSSSTNLLNDNLRFSRIAREFVRSLQFAKPWFRVLMT